MPYRLNVDMWHPVNPEDQKITRLSRGDEVPDWALPEGDDLKAVTEGRNPMFLRDEEETPRASATSSGTQPGRELGEASGVRSDSPQQPRDKK